MNIQMQQAVVSTQKSIVKNADKSRLLLSATYMNNIKKYSSSEFDIVILGLYCSFEGEGEIDLPKPKVEVDGKLVEIEELENDNDILKDLPNFNIWSKYYLISAQKSAAQFFNVTAEIYPFPKASLALPKEF